MGWNRNFVHGRCALNETINIQVVAQRCFEGLRERGVPLRREAPAKLGRVRPAGGLEAMRYELA